eukprot:1195074-Prorocentrum_minimum.AAC.3
MDFTHISTISQMCNGGIRLFFTFCTFEDRRSSFDYLLDPTNLALPAVGESRMPRQVIALRAITITRLCRVKSYDPSLGHST